MKIRKYLATFPKEKTEGINCNNTKCPYYDNSGKYMQNCSAGAKDDDPLLPYCMDYIPIKIKKIKCLSNKNLKELDFYYIKEIKTGIYEKCYAKDEQDPDSDKVSILDDGITFYNNSGNDHRIFIPFSDILLKK